MLGKQIQLCAMANMLRKWTPFSNWKGTEEGMTFPGNLLAQDQIMIFQF